VVLNRERRHAESDPGGYRLAIRLIGLVVPAWKWSTGLLPALGGAMLADGHRRGRRKAAGVWRVHQRHWAGLVGLSRGRAISAPMRRLDVVTHNGEK